MIIWGVENHCPKQNTKTGHISLVTGGPLPRNKLKWIDPIGVQNVSRLVLVNYKNLEKNVSMATLYS
jgi:hypothetical protein